MDRDAPCGLDMFNVDQTLAFYESRTFNEVRSVRVCDVVLTSLQSDVEATFTESDGNRFRYEGGVERFQYVDGELYTSSRADTDVTDGWLYMFSDLRRHNFSLPNVDFLVSNGEFPHCAPDRPDHVQKNCRVPVFVHVNRRGIDRDFEAPWVGMAGFVCFAVGVAAL